MKIQIDEEKREPPVEIQRTTKMILTREEYDNFESLFCEGKGWSLDYPRTVNVRSITLTGNYKWMPVTDVEFHIDVEEKERLKQ